MSKLNQGDVVFKTQNGYYVAELVVERVTATQAILKDGTKLKREHIDDHIKKIGAETWSSDGYWADTEQNRKHWESAFQRANAKKLAAAIAAAVTSDYLRIGVERLERIQAIINEKTTNRE